ncbi:MAG: hypothetical protein R2715_12345 [Ilumatobacteraceae bacterium]
MRTTRALYDRLAELVAVGLGLEPDFFEACREASDRDPAMPQHWYERRGLSRIQHRASSGWGAHTDYGILTLLGKIRYGLQEVLTKSGWRADVVPVPVPTW